MIHRASPPAHGTRLSAQSFRHALSALAFGLLLCTTPASAQTALAPYDEVTRQIRAGQLDSAIAAADQYLQGQPADPQMRFIRGVALQQKGQAQEAQAVFQRLTEEFPELPEPHNNLAVLHAAAGRYDEARAALDAAIRANPAYAVAHENLGDVYARLAQRAWAQSQAIDAGNARLAPKLQAVQQLLGTAPAPAASPAPR